MNRVNITRPPVAALITFIVPVFRAPVAILITFIVPVFRVVGQVILLMRPSLGAAYPRPPLLGITDHTRKSGAAGPRVSGLPQR
jgi:hypothetical protein